MLSIPWIKNNSNNIFNSASLNHLKRYIFYSANLKYLNWYFKFPELTISRSFLRFKYNYCCIMVGGYIKDIFAAKFQALIIKIDRYLTRGKAGIAKRYLIKFIKKCIIIFLNLLFNSFGNNLNICND